MASEAVGCDTTAWARYVLSCGAVSLGKLNRGCIVQAKKRKAPAKSSGGNGDRPKAQKLGIAQLVVLNAYSKTFSTGKSGFFGKVLDPATGKRYQVVHAVEIAG